MFWGKGEGGSLQGGGKGGWDNTIACIHALVHGFEKGNIYVIP